MDDTEVFQPGASDSALLENAQRFYTKFAENRHKLHFSLAESKRIIVPYTKNIFLGQRKGNIGIIKRPDSAIDDTKDYYFIEQIWLLKKNIWRPLLTSVLSCEKIKLINLNNDKYDDAISEVTNGDWHSIGVYIGDPSEILVPKEGITAAGNVTMNFTKPCSGEIKTVDRTNSANIKLARFDCNSNGFAIR